LKKIFFVFALFLTLSSSLYGAETLYTWGYGDIIGEAMKMIKNIFLVENISNLWKLVLIISMIMGTFKMMLPKSDLASLPKIFIGSMAVWSLFVTTTTDLYIDDKTNANNNVVVTDVPYAVARPFAIFSEVNRIAGEMYESAGSLSSSGSNSSINYTNSGMLTGLNVFQHTTGHKIVDPTISQNVENYIFDCVMPDIEGGFKDYNSITQSTGLWTYLGNTNPSIIASYRNTDGSNELLNCLDFYSRVSGVLNTYVTTTGLDFMANQIGTLSATSLSSAIGTSSSYLHGVAKTATATLLQNVSINSFSSAFQSYSAINGISGEGAAYYAGKAESTASSNMIISGILGSKYIPVTKGILLTIIASLTPFIALSMLTPLAFKALVGYFTILSWLSLWQVGEVVLNHIIMTKAESYITGFSDYTIEVKPLIDSSVIDYINMASSMYWMIPTISLLIVGGFSISTFSQMSGGMTQRAARGEMAATEMGSGNVGHGNVGHNSYNANAMNSTKSSQYGTSSVVQDMAGTLSNGNFTGNGNSATKNGLGGNAASMFDSGASSLLNNTFGGIGGGFGVTGSDLKGNSSFSNNGNGSYQANSAFTFTDTQGNTVSGQQGAMFKDNGNGSYSPQTGNFGFSGSDSNGNQVNLSNMEFLSGKMTAFTGTDESGVSVTGTQYGNNTTRTASIGNTSITETNGEVTGATIDGVKYNSSQLQSMRKSEQSQTSSTVAESSGSSTQNIESNGTDISHLSSKAHKEGVKTDDTTNSTYSANLKAGVSFDSKQSAVGTVFSKLAGVGAKVDAGGGYAYNIGTGNNVGTSNETGETYNENSTHGLQHQVTDNKTNTASNGRSSSISQAKDNSSSTASEHNKLIQLAQNQLDNSEGLSLTDVVSNLNTNKGNIPNNETSVAIDKVNTGEMKTPEDHAGKPDMTNDIDSVVKNAHANNGGSQSMEKSMLGNADVIASNVADFTERMTWRTPGSDGKEEIQNSINNRNTNFDKLIGNDTVEAPFLPSGNGTPMMQPYNSAYSGTAMTGDLSGNGSNNLKDTLDISSGWNQNNGNINQTATRSSDVKGGRFSDKDVGESSFKKK